MAKRTRGRPEKVKDERRENVLRIRLTQTERGILDAAAAGRALDVSSWARMVLIETARPVAKPGERAKG